MGTNLSSVIRCDCIRKINILESQNSQKIKINLRNSQSSIETKMKYKTLVC